MFVSILHKRFQVSSSAPTSAEAEDDIKAKTWRELNEKADDDSHRFKCTTRNVFWEIFNIRLMFILTITFIQIFSFIYEETTQNERKSLLNKTEPAFFR